MTFSFDALRGATEEAKVAPFSEGAKPSGSAGEEALGTRRALLVGQPNVGKSVVFGALTGTYVTVSNYPGTTVEITRGHAKLGDVPWEIIDTPGTHNLVPMSEDEAVTRDLLVSERHDALVQVGDAKSLSRTLLLALQLAELGVPFCLDLNMLDEARARGLTIDLDALERELPGIRVNASTATENEGLDAVREYLRTHAARSDRASGEVERAPLPCAARFPDDVEAALADIEAHIRSPQPVAKRALATMLLAGERGASGMLSARAGADATRVAKERGAALARAHGVPAFALLSRLRLSRAQAIVRLVQRREVLTTATATAERARPATAVAMAGAFGLLAALTIDGALTRTAVASKLDPLAGYGVIAIASRIVSRDLFAQWNAVGLVLLAIAVPAAFAVVRRQTRARSASWKLVAVFTTGWAAYWASALVQGLAGGPFTSAPVYAGVVAGAVALAVAFFADPARDADVSRVLGRTATHPVWGLAVLAVVLLLAYKVVGVFGAGTAVDFIENRIFGSPVAKTSLDAPAADATAALATHDVADEGAVRLVTLADGPASARRVRVVSQVKHDGAYVADPAASIDVYPASAVVERRPGEVIVQNAPSGAEAREWSGFVNRVAFGFFAWLGIPIVTAFFVGPYGMLTMGVTYAVAIVLPVVATFFFVFSMLEDSGYLPRLAIMANRGLRSMGLNGRAVLPMVLGLGCDTMATLTARIMETRKERTLVTLLLALGVPCSSQLSVIFALMQRTSHVATLVWLAVVIGTLLTVGWVAARVLPGESSDFLLEMPPMRQPMVGNLVAKTMARLEWYLKEAVPLFLAGTAFLFVLDATHSLVYVHRIGEPIVNHVLGFGREGGVADRVSEALLVGFLRRDFGAAGMLDLARAGKLSPADVAVSMVTITLFIPCIANVFMMAKERGWKVAGAMSAFIFPYAIAVGALVRFGFRAFGG
jgi:Fe2+ transport system protein B